MTWKRVEDVFLDEAKEKKRDLEAEEMGGQRKL